MLPLRRLLFRKPNLKNKHTAPAAPPRRALPQEVWDCILSELSDDYLLVAARVCSAFNERCIAEYLHRRNVSRAQLESGNKNTLSLSSDLLRVFNQLSARSGAHQLDTLECRFWAFHVRRDLRFLREYVRRTRARECGDIRNLAMFFHGNVLEAHETDIVFPYSRQQLLTEIAAVLRAMAGDNPMVVMDGSDIQLIGPRFTLTPVKSHRTRCRLVWEHKTRMLIGEIRSIHCSSVGEGTARPFTLITFNQEVKPTVRFGARFLSQQAEIKAYLPHIDLPGLANVRIAVPVDPTLLAPFLVRHRTIQSIHWELGSEIAARPLLTCPIALPSLTHIECTHAAHLASLLENLGRHAPLLDTISIPLHRGSPAEVATVNGAFRALAALPSLHLHLHLRVWDVGKQPWEPIGSVERDVLGALHNISAVRVEADSVPDVRCLLPWLAMLPALQHVEVRIFQRWAPLVDEMRTALSAVGGIEVKRR